MHTHAVKVSDEVRGTFERVLLHQSNPGYRQSASLFLGNMPAMEQEEQYVMVLYFSQLLVTPTADMPGPVSE